MYFIRKLMSSVRQMCWSYCLWSRSLFSPSKAGVYTLQIRIRSRRVFREYILTFREIGKIHVSLYAKKLDDPCDSSTFLVPRNDHFRTYLFLASLQINPFFALARQRVRYEDAIFFLYERYRASEILEESSVLRIINRVSANDPLKKLAKVEQLIARSWMAT